MEEARQMRIGQGRDLQQSRPLLHQDWRDRHRGLQQKRYSRIPKQRLLNERTPTKARSRHVRPSALFIRCLRLMESCRPPRQGQGALDPVVQRLESAQTNSQRTRSDQVHAHHQRRCRHQQTRRDPRQMVNGESFIFLNCSNYQSSSTMFRSNLPRNKMVTLQIKGSSHTIDIPYTGYLFVTHRNKTIMIRYGSATPYHSHPRRHDKQICTEKPAGDLILMGSDGAISLTDESIMMQIIEFLFDNEDDLMCCTYDIDGLGYQYDDTYRPLIPNRVMVFDSVYKNSTFTIVVMRTNIACPRDSVIDEIYLPNIGWFSLWDEQELQDNAWNPAHGEIGQIMAKFTHSEIEWPIYRRFKLFTIISGKDSTKVSWDAIINKMIAKTSPLSCAMLFGITIKDTLRIDGHAAYMITDGCFTHRVGIAITSQPDPFKQQGPPTVTLPGQQMQSKQQIQPKSDIVVPPTVTLSDQQMQDMVIQPFKDLVVMGKSLISLVDPTTCPPEYIHNFNKMCHAAFRSESLLHDGLIRIVEMRKAIMLLEQYIKPGQLFQRDQQVQHDQYLIVPPTVGLSGLQEPAGEILNPLVSKAERLIRPKPNPMLDDYQRRIMQDLTGSGKVSARDQPKPDNPMPKVNVSPMAKISVETFDEFHDIIANINDDLQKIHKYYPKEKAQPLSNEFEELIGGSTTINSAYGFNMLIRKAASLSLRVCEFLYDREHIITSPTKRKYMDSLTKRLNQQIPRDLKIDYLRSRFAADYDFSRHSDDVIDKLYKAIN